MKFVEITFTVSAAAVLPEYPPALVCSGSQYHGAYPCQPYPQAWLMNWEHGSRL